MTRGGARQLGLPAAIALLALVVRLVPVLRSDALVDAVVEYDDGIHVGAALRLAHGMLPYDDFLFVQPPGIAVLLAPLALLAELGGEAAALVTGKLLLMVVGAVNGALLCVVVRRHHGAVAGGAAGAIYAVWATTAAAERTVLLEPLLNLAILVAVLLLEPGRATRGRALLAGAALGLGTVVKVWLLPVAVVVGVWVLLTSGRRVLGLVAAGAVGVALVVAGPFLLAAPQAMWDQVVLDQLGRGRGPDVQFRLTLLAGDPFGLTGQIGGRTIAAAMGLVVVAAFAAGLWAGARLWVALLALELAMLLSSPTFYYHYGAFLALPLCALLGAGLGRLATVAPGALQRPAVVGLGLVLMVWAASELETAGTNAVDRAALSRFTATHECLWTNSASATLLGDAALRRSSGRCEQELDLLGVLLDATRGEGLNDLTLDARSVPSWQSLVREELGRSDGVVIDDDVRYRETHFDAGTMRLFAERFERVGGTGGLTFYARR